MARITHYDQGDLWRPTATFEVGDVATDPTTITIRVKEPDGTITTHGPVAGATGGGEITRVSAGVFRIDIDLDAAGYWYARFEGTGAATATEEHQAVADPSEFTAGAGVDARALVGLAETKDWLNRQQIDTSDDLDLVRVIDDISNRFHDEAGREFKAFGTNPQERQFDASDVGWKNGVVAIGDCADVDAVEIVDRDWTTVLETAAATDYSLLPLNREAWEPIRRIQLNHSNGVTLLRAGYRVQVTGSFGFPAVPGNVRQAVLDAVAATLDRDVENYRTDLSPAADTTGGSVVLVQSPMFLSLPPSSLAVARLYRDPLVG